MPGLTLSWCILICCCNSQRGKLQIYLQVEGLITSRIKVGGAFAVMNVWEADWRMFPHVCVAFRENVFVSLIVSARGPKAKLFAIIRRALTPNLPWPSVPQQLHLQAWFGCTVLHLIRSTTYPQRMQCRTWLWWCTTAWCPESCIYRQGLDAHA